MAQNYPLAAWVALLSALVISCSDQQEKADIPLYLDLPDLRLETDYENQGSAHSKMTTVWVTLNDENLGAYDLPATLPLLPRAGQNQLRLTPGINLNGISASRAIYETYEDLDLSFEFPENPQRADTLQPETAERTTRYRTFAQVRIVEDFDRAGSNLERSGSSDTNFVKVSGDGQTFTNPHHPDEDNGQAGLLITTPDKTFAEVSTVNTYNLPTAGQNVYVELTYRNNQPFLVGVIASVPTGNVQQQTAVINPRQDWNKIYINLITELSSFTNASNFKLFIGASHDQHLDTGKVYLDNIKLVY